MADENPQSRNECYVAKSTHKKNTLMWWHEKLAHQNFNYIKKLLTLSGLTWEKTAENPFCEACIQGK